MVVGEYTELLKLNCYTYKFCMILNYQYPNLYFEYLSLTDIQYFTTLTTFTG
ncbi:hypothetical protein Hanom_Chr00s000004g01608331 [Helianthus anomalus]